MRARESKCQILQDDTLRMKCSEFTCVLTILVKFDMYFLGSRAKYWCY